MSRLSPGDTVAHYEIRAHVGAGGMGDVYLAEDRKLHRPVALKVLRGGDDVEHEARAASAMNHPNAAHIYEIGEAGDAVYIAMEYVEGESLERRLQRGPLPEDEAIEIAVQLADALGEAKAKGIVHRDLKPGNVVINSRGQAKILDFGIARRTSESLLDADTAPDGVLGTLPYMSPEQLRGRDVDHRSDIFSLGIVLFEMVTGRRPFDGESVHDTVNRIVGFDPPMEDVPERLRPVVARCLAKDRERRYENSREIVAELGRRRVDEPPSRQRGIAAGLVVAVVAIVAVVMMTRRPEQAPPPAPPRLIKITAAPGLEDEPAVSPDGQRLAYTSDERGNLDVFVRPIAGGEAIRLTDSDADDAQPAWSPDGTRIAFVSARDRAGRLSIVLGQALLNFVNAKGGDLFVVPAAGGAATKVIDNAYYPAFSPDGKWIVFGSSRGGRWDLWKIPSAGGRPIQLTSDEDFDYQPSWSPNGESIVYASGVAGMRPYRLKLIGASGGAPRPVTDGRDVIPLKPVFAADGKSVIYASGRGGSMNLWRLPLAPNASPEPVTLGEGDDVHPSVSGKRIVYTTVRQTPDLWSLDLSTGKAEQLTFDTGKEEFPHRSRDGVILFSSDRGGRDALWLLEPGGGTRELWARRAIGQPRWSPDGKRILYRFDDGGAATIAVQEPGSAELRVVTRDAEAPSFSPDGKRIAFTGWTRQQPKGQITIAEADGSLRRLTSLDVITSYPTWSPDGKFISFQATRDDGTRHVWIVDVATGALRRLTSGASEDSHPQWSPVDPDTILFVRNHENLMTVSVSTGAVRALTSYSEPNMVLDYPAWSPDGKRVDFSIARKRGDLYMLER